MSDKQTTDDNQLAVGEANQLETETTVEQLRCIPIHGSSIQMTRGDKIRQSISRKREVDPIGFAEKQKKASEKRKQTIAEKRQRDPVAWEEMQRQKGDKRKKTISQKKDKTATERDVIEGAAGPALSPSANLQLNCSDQLVGGSGSTGQQLARVSINTSVGDKRRRSRAEERERDPIGYAEKQKKASEKRKQTVEEKRQGDPIGFAEKQKKASEKRKQTVEEKRQRDPIGFAEKQKKASEKRKQTIAEKRQRDPQAWEEMQQKKAETVKTAITGSPSNEAPCDDQQVGRTDNAGFGTCELQTIIAADRTSVIYTPQKKQRSIPNRRSLFQNPADDGSKTVCDPYSVLLRKYFANIRQGPTNICCCCGGLFYQDGVRNVVMQTLQLWGCNQDTIKAVLHLRSEDDDTDPPNGVKQQFTLCITCYNTARGPDSRRGRKEGNQEQRIPRLALSNGLDFPVLPVELQELSQLEERCVAPRLPFMQMRLAGFQHQWSLRGNVVNVECNINTCVTSLPRRFDEMTVVQLQLMRRMSYRRPYLYDKIRPAKVLCAIKYLLKTPLYELDNVTLSENWETEHSEEEIPFIVGEVNSQSEQSMELQEENEVIKDIEQSKELQEENEVVEDIVQNTEDNGAVHDDQTLLFDEDFATLGIRIAPAEGNIPIALYRDPNAELLSFPSIYCGQLRTLRQNVRLTYTDIVKSELRRYDRRCCKSEKLFYAFKKSYNEKVRDAYQICLRQKPSHHQGNAITAGMLKESGYIKHLITKDDGYAVYKNVRCTPAYWKEQCKRVTSMIRQLGVPTFFITLSAAEARWSELLVILTNVLQNQQVGETEVEQLSYEERAKLIRDDPVTCMRHFDHKYKAFLNKLLKPINGVFAPHGVQDWYSRIEFQMRGSPHSHGLYWLQDAPIYTPEDPDSERVCVNFIDKFITCRRDQDEEISELIAYQLHRHTHTCRKGKRKVRKCRFNYPRPPLDQTQILHPLPSDFPQDERQRLCALYTKVEVQLDGWGRDYKEETTTTDMLAILGISEMDYLGAVRTTIKRPTVFLKRMPKEAFMNAYNRKIMFAWKANMDIQFVLDGYACGKYVATYISKSGGGVSKLLRAAAADVSDGNRDIPNKLQKFASILINGCEISAQEAAAFCLGTHLISSSRDAIFVNTSLSTQRVRMLKPQKEIDELPENSDDIYQKGVSDRYAKRPADMEHICFAEFVTSYSKANQKRTKDPVADLDEDIEHEVLLDESDNIKYYKRERAKILRFCNFSKVTSPNDYWREQIMLFRPWRSEINDVEEIGDFEHSAMQDEQVILENSRQFYKLREAIQTLEGTETDFNIDVLEEDVEEEEHIFDEVQQEVEIENRQYTKETLSSKRVPTSAKFLPPKLVHRDEYFRIMRSLNQRQRRIVLEILHLLKTGKLPFYIFLSGGAGVGKSHVITAIVQSFLRHCNKLAHLSPESPPIVVCAPTGKAAFNVFGMTLHNVFRLPPSQYPGPIAQLDDSTANTLRKKFANTVLFIIDEISMVGAIQLKHIDSRLRQLFDKEKPFGGKSILAVGHLRQLPPVGMNYIFECPKLRGVEAIRGALVARNPLWAPFQFYELTEIMRQRNAHAFCKALNNMSEGIMDDDDIALIKSRTVKKEDAPRDAVWLFRTNPECHEHNSEMHGQMGTDSALSTAVDKVTGHRSPFEASIFKEDAKTFKQSESDGMMYNIQLQVGGIYFVTTNIDVSDGLFNGATGILRAIEYGVKAGTAEKIPISAWMEFPHQSIGQEVRRNPAFLPRCQRLKFPTSWTPIDRMSRRLTKELHGMHITRTQIPIHAANGMTITKSQGSSLPKVVVTIRPGISRANLYVACSRATNLEEFYIVGDFKKPNKPGKTDMVTPEMERLHNNPVIFRLQFPETIANNTRIYFHNVEGYLQHQADLLADNNIISHEYLLLVEPQITNASTISLPGFTTTFRQNSVATNGRCNSEGVLFFSKDSDSSNPQMSLITMKEVNKHCLLLTGFVKGVYIIAAYKHPAFPTGRFKQLLAQQLDDHKSDQLLVFGDMNIDLTDPSNLSFVDFFQERNLVPVIDFSESTTDYNTHLDVCFTNVQSLKASVYENYYSYHKALSIEW